MDPDFDFLLTYFIYSMRAIVALFSSVFLVIVSRRSRANLPLGVIFLVIGLLYLRNGFVRLPVMDMVDVFNPLSYYVLIFIAPFSIFYVWHALGERHTVRSYLLHFLPFAFALLLLAGLKLSGEPRIQFCDSIIDLWNYRGEYPLHTAFLLTLMLVFVLQVVSYFSMALLKILRIMKIYKAARLPLRSLKILITMAFLLLLYPLVCVVFLSFNNEVHYGTVFNFFVPFVIFAISMLSFSLILPIKTDIDFISKPDKKIKSAFKASVVDTDKNGKDDRLIAGIRALLEERELFRLPDLTLGDIASETCSNRSYVSAAINRHFGCNLKRLLTRYRIEAAKELLLNSDLNINIIAEKVGFNSRSTFYSAFREELGETITPGEWRERENMKA